MVLSVTCSGCGSQVPAGDRFCGSCGNPITGSAILSGEGAAAFDPWIELLQKLRQATLGEYEIKGELGRGGRYRAGEIGEAATGIGRNMDDVGLAVQRAKDKTEQLQARAAAVEELTAAGTLEDFTSTDDDIDRQLKQIQQGGQVEDELSRLKRELAGGPDEPKGIAP